MNPAEIYNEIEAAWKGAAIESMVLKEIVEGRKKANPAAFTFEEQYKKWTHAAGCMRSILDDLADMKHGSTPGADQGGATATDKENAP